MNSSGCSILAPLNNIPAPRAGSTKFSVPMATLGIANWFWQHRLQIALSVATYIISSSMCVFGPSMQRTNFDNMSLLTSNTPGGITIYIEHKLMQTPRQPMANSRSAVLTEDSMCFNIFPISWEIFLSLTCFIQCRSASLTTSSSGFSTSCRRTNSSTSTMQSGFPCLLTTTSHQKKSHMKKYVHGMGRRWRK